MKFTFIIKHMDKNAIDFLNTLKAQFNSKNKDKEFN